MPKASWSRRSFVTRLFDYALARLDEPGFTGTEVANALKVGAVYISCCSGNRGSSVDSSRVVSSRRGCYRSVFFASVFAQCCSHSTEDSWSSGSAFGSSKKACRLSAYDVYIPTILLIPSFLMQRSSQTLAVVRGHSDGQKVKR